MNKAINKPTLPYVHYFLRYSMGDASADVNYAFAGLYYLANIFLYSSLMANIIWLLSALLEYFPNGIYHAMLDKNQP